VKDVDQNVLNTMPKTWRRLLQKDPMSTADKWLPQAVMYCAKQHRVSVLGHAARHLGRVPAKRMEIPTQTRKEFSGLYLLIPSVHPEFCYVVKDESFNPSYDKAANLLECPGPKPMSHQIRHMV
jgi:hypothetical protein